MLVTFWFSLGAAPRILCQCLAALFRDVGFVVSLGMFPWLVCCMFPGCGYFLGCLRPAGRGVMAWLSLDRVVSLVVSG